jgi:hypothetical protein
MNNTTRRGFLADVGRGMLVASLGAAVTRDMGLAYAHAADDDAPLEFGALEPLVGLIQDTPADRLLPLLVQRINDGADLKTLIAAGALANARTFGGQDYTGYHALMALVPAYEMAQDCSEHERALPVLKVLYRNTKRIQDKGGRRGEVLKRIAKTEVTPEQRSGPAVRDLVRQANMDGAERAFAAIAHDTPGEAFNHLQFTVQDEIDVHRVVLAWRAWTLLDYAGPENAHTLLRQSVRHCVDVEKTRIDRQREPSPLRTFLPRLFDQYRLEGRPIGSRTADDAWIEQMSQTIYSGKRAAAAEAVAGALADGFSPDSIAEAMSIAASRLVLRDPGRESGDAEKPKGSVHGASVGVHASDAVHAWRNIARVTNPRNTFASLIVGAYHTAEQNHRCNPQSLPLAEHLQSVKSTNAKTLLGETEEAIKANDQIRACALVQHYGAVDGPAKPLFNVMLKYACSEDGALHAEKYFRTVMEEYAATRPSLRWQHVVALARVTASEYGFPAPGYRQARELLKV